MDFDSDALEEYIGRLRQQDKELGKFAKGTKVTRGGDLKNLTELGKEWLRISTKLRNIDGIRAETLSTCDDAMRELLNLVNARSAANSFRLKLATVIEASTNDLLVPLVIHEGSPAQSAARFVLSVFDGIVDEEEAEYIGEAGRCVTVRSYRAAQIMLWAAGVARLHRSILQVGFDRLKQASAVTASKKGSPFNRFSPLGHIQGMPELQVTRDFDLLVVGMELWGYDMPIFDELQRLLGQRNGAAHPGMLKCDVYDVQHYAQKLRKYLFERVSLKS